MSRKTIRFAVTDGGAYRAATWKLWTQKSECGQEIYLSCREINGALHTSFHPTGEWHTTFTEKALSQLKGTETGAAGPGRLQSWSPKEVRDGVVLAYKILTPAAAVTTPLDPATKAKINPIANAPAGHANETMVFVVRQGIMLRSGKATVVARLALPDGANVVVINHMIPMPQIAPPIARGRGTFFQGRSKADLIAAANLRTLVFVDDAYGNKMILDTRVARPDEVTE